MPVKACTWQELMENLQHRDTENADKNVGNEIMLGHRDTKNADFLFEVFYSRLFFQFGTPKIRTKMAL